MENSILQYLDDNKESTYKHFNYLHSIPELAFEEFKTSQYLANIMEEIGYSVKTGVGKTGIICEFDTERPGPCIGLRAEMDALSHEVENKKVLIHSCGHDANCSAILSVAEAIVNSNVLDKGKVKIIFQPAEETLSGAYEVIKSNEIDDLDYLIGIHLRPIEELPYGKITPSVRHGASEILLVDIVGLDAHGARPHQGINSIDVCCSIIQTVNNIHMNPQIPYSVKATMVSSGGNAYNVIPGKARIAFDLRAQTNDLMSALKNRLIDTIIKGANMYDAVAEYNFKGQVPAAQDSDDLILIAKDSITKVLGESGLSDCIITSGGEDFHLYAQSIEGLKTTIIGVGADLAPGLHKPNMKFKQEAIIDASKVLALMVTNILNNSN